MIEYARHNTTWVGIALAIIGIAGALIVLPLPAALVTIGGAVAALAVLRWHELALSAAILAVPYGSWFPLALGVGNLTAVDLAVALLVALWLVQLLAQERRLAIRFPPLTLPFGLFLLAALISTLGAQSLELAIKEMTKWIEMFAVYLYIANTFDAAKIKRALAVMFFAGATQAAIGVYQFLFRWGPKGFLLFDRFIRAFGTFEQPNPFAGYLAMLAPVALGVVISVALLASDFKLEKLARLDLKLGVLNFSFVALAAVAGVLMVAAIGMSWSRAGWFALGAGALVTVIVQSRRAFVGSVLVAFVLTFVILLSSINLIPAVIADRFSGVADYFGVFDVRGVKVDDANFALVERMAHWQAAAEMFAAHPLTGIGIGNYAVAYADYSLPRWDDPLGHAHNYYLNMAAETGLLGASAYLGLWFAAFWQTWRAIRAAEGGWRSVAAGLLGMFVALATQSGFDNLFVHGMAVQVGVGLGLIAAIRNLPGAARPG